MPLESKVKQKWEILYYRHNDHRCDAEEYLEKIPKNDYDQFVARIDCLAKGGRTALTAKMFHEAGEDVVLYKRTEKEKKCKMYGLHQGRYRLYAILVEKDEIIIFTHGTLKSTRATDRQDKDRFKSIVRALKDEGEL